MGNQPERRKSKRLASTLGASRPVEESWTVANEDGTLAAYDEQDGDFVFTRAAKKVKAAQTIPEDEVLEPAPLPPLQPRKASNSRPGRPAGKKRAQSSEPVDISVPTPPAAQPTGTRRSSRRISNLPPTESQDETLQLIVPKTRPPQRRTRASIEKEQRVKEETVPESSQQPLARKKSRKPVEQAPATPQPQPMEVDEDAVQNQRHNDAGAQKIALPFSDTPVINRNKEMRKKGGNGGSRRSSLGMRGRRASSLIENGHSAIPHKEVDPSEFYKHIEAESLLEPRRMKQLLTWCGERALCDKPPHGSRGSSAILGGEYHLICFGTRGHADIFLN